MRNAIDPGLYDTQPNQVITAAPGWRVAYTTSTTVPVVAWAVYCNPVPTLVPLVVEAGDATASPPYSDEPFEIRAPHDQDGPQ